MEKIVLASTEDVKQVSNMNDAVNDYFEKHESVMTMPTVVVAPDYRGRGFGEKLVRFGIDFCKNSGAKTIRLDTHYRNVPARRLYEKCGFVSLGCHKAFVDGVIQEFDVFEYRFL